MWMNDEANAVRDLGIEEVKTGLSDGTLLLVDVREPHEVDAGAIPNSVSMPLSRFDPSALPRDARVVFSCAAGVRSLRALDIARGAGLDLNEHFGGGFRAWVAAGEPVVSGAPNLSGEDRE